MPRILAIDYGRKRCGIAVTDQLKLIARPLITVKTIDLMNYLESYFKTEPVETVVVGQPFRFDGSHPEIETEILYFIVKFSEKFPVMKVERVNEMFTSKEAMRSLIASGVKKKQRRDKSLLDSASAALILQDYLQNCL
jgi:putative Holliday junction resolvase